MAKSDDTNTPTSRRTGRPLKLADERTRQLIYKILRGRVAGGRCGQGARDSPDHQE